MNKLNLSSFLMLLLGTSSQASTATQVPIMMGTGNIDGVYYQIGNTLCALYQSTLDADTPITQSAQDAACSVQDTQGSITNLYQLADENFNFAIVQSDWQHYAYTGSYVFATQGDQHQLRAVAALHDEPFTIVAHRDAGINSFEDLRDKTVNIGEPGSGHRNMFEMMMRAQGETMQIYQAVTQYSPQAQTIALCEHDIDAFLFTTGQPSTLISNAFEQCPVSLVPVTGQVVDRLVAQTAFYNKTFISKNSYPQLHVDIPTYGVRAVLVTHQAVPTEQVYALVDALITQFDTVKQTHPALAQLKVQDLLEVGDVPLHPGALQAYHEHQLIR